MTNLKFDVKVTQNKLPNARERHSLSKLSKSKMILFGGIHKNKFETSIMNDTWLLEYHDDFMKFNWKPLKMKEKPKERYDHTSCQLMDKKVIIFGGLYEQVDQNEVTSEFLNDVWILTEKSVNQDTLYEWSAFSTKNSPKPR